MLKITEQELARFVLGFAEDTSSLDLLLLLGRHPHARLSRLAIVHALGWQRVNVDKILRGLAERGLIDKCTENGASFYRLTNAEPGHSLAQRLAALDPQQRRSLLEARQTDAASVIMINTQHQ